MGKEKKHKKHKTAKREHHELDPESGHLRLVLKVGGSSGEYGGHQQTPSQCVTPFRVNTTAQERSDHSPSSHRKDKKHKKKKKKDREKDKGRHKGKHKKLKRSSDECAERRHFATAASNEAISESSFHLPSDTCSGEVAALSARPPVASTAAISQSPPPQSSAADVAMVSVEKSGDPLAYCQDVQPSQFHQSARRPGAGRPTMSVAVSDLLCLGEDTDHRAGRSALQRFLAYIQRALQLKDPQSFFATPVTDSLAPGYSSIISQPMDFSTMTKKNDNAEYSDLAAFQEDFRLMCANAMIYNRMDTKYYKAAKRLLHVGTKMMHADKLVCLRQLLPYMCELSDQQLGFNMQEVILEQQQQQQQSGGAAEAGGVASRQELVKPLSNTIEADHSVVVMEKDRSDTAATAGDGDAGGEVEEVETESVKEQAVAAAQRASQLLKNKYNKPPELGFLRQRSDGTTSLAILTPSAGDDCNDERPVSIGVLSGKLSHGASHLSAFKEDRRNYAKPVKSLYYGSYCSFAPSYDSTFSNLNCEQSELLFQTYGDETCQQYAQSLRRFVSECEPAVEIVDKLLDTLTGGQHTRTQTLLTEDRVLSAALSSSTAAKNTTKQDTTSPANHSSERGDDPNTSELVTSLRSLNDIGIDVSFLDAFEEVERRQTNFQQQLDSSARLLSSLANSQQSRLSQPQTGQSAGKLSPPSSQELQLARQLSESITDMVAQTRPADVSSVSSLRRAMGVGAVTSS